MECQTTVNIVLGDLLSSQCPQGCYYFCKLHPALAYHIVTNGFPFY